MNGINGMNGTNGTKNKDLRIEDIFIFGALAIALIYFYFFLFLPQSWSLNDDYGQVKDWGLDPNLNPWSTGLAFFKGRLGEGRFLFVDSFTRLWRYKFLPLEPMYFRLTQISLLALALAGFGWFLKKLELSKYQIAFALMIVMANLSVKEWIVLTAAAETIATPFFFLSLAAYGSKRRWLGVFLFVMSFLSKESFVFLAGTYFVLDLIEFFSHRYRSTQPFEKKFFAPTVAIFILSITFLITVSKLPRVYTGGSHFLSFSIKDIFVALIWPPAKCYGFAILYVLLTLSLHFWKNRGQPLGYSPQVCRQFFERAAIAVAIIIPISMMLVGWAPYNSWGYLQLVIPFGWAFLLASLLQQPPSIQLAWSRLARLVLALSLVMVSVLTTLWGSMNRWSFLSEAKLVADMACEDYRKNPNIKFYSNCEEGASQLQNYLLIYNKNCPNPPMITHTPGLPKDAKAPYEVLLGEKWCVGDSQSFNGIPKTKSYKFHSWSLVKNLPQN